MLKLNFLISPFKAFNKEDLKYNIHYLVSYLRDIINKINVINVNSGRLDRYGSDGYIDARKPAKNGDVKIIILL